jgi:hypothetical protein
MDSKLPMGRSGFLLLKPLAKRIFLVDSKEQVIAARFLLKDEQIITGSILDFKDHSILVGERVSSHQVDFSPSDPQGFNLSRSFAQVVKSHAIPQSSSLPEAPLVRWKASCSTFQDGSKSFQAFLLLRPHAKRLVLLDTDEQILDARFLLENERVHSGLIMDLQSHTVVVGERIISDSLALGVDFLKSSPPKLDSIPQQNPPLGTSHVPALDFSIGASFQANCKNKFGHDVTPTINSHRRAFLLVASFGRASFKLDIHTVAIALQSCFGGLACSYRVKHLRDRSFQFSVASTSVGFEIYNKSKVCTPMFELYINL